MPLVKRENNFYNYITPKISFRINPSDMKDHSSDEKRINTDNIFDLNRFGIDDSFESGYSATVGIDYNTKNLNEDQSYLELKLATVIRDNEESKIPSKTSGSISFNLDCRYSIISSLYFRLPDTGIKL